MDLHEEIARLAYELYERGGRAEGRDRENWLEAEKIIKARHAGDLGVARQMELSAESVAKKVKEAVKETVSGVKSAAKKVKTTAKRA
jgi:DUF2934 family protein